MTSPISSFQRALLPIIEGTIPQKRKSRISIHIGTKPPKRSSWILSKWQNLPDKKPEDLQKKIAPEYAVLARILGKDFSEEKIGLSTQTRKTVDKIDEIYEESLRIVEKFFNSLDPAEKRTKDGLVIQNSNLQLIPPTLLAEELAHIELQNNPRLCLIPTEISLLQSTLKSLIIDISNIEFIPSSIGALKSLEVLQLKNSLVKSLPKELENCENLNYLNLRNNQIKTFPPPIKNLKNCKYLVLSGNYLKKLPEKLFRNLPSLTCFKAAKNALTSLPKDLGFLESLDLHGNRLTSLPAEWALPSSCEYLKKLNISKNPLVEKENKPFLQFFQKKKPLCTFITGVK